MMKYFIELKERLKERYVCKETAIIIVVIVLFMIVLSNILPEIPTKERYIFPPLIFVDDSCYVCHKYGYNEDEIPSQKIFIGFIQSTVSYRERPSEHLQANREIKGVAVYQSGESLYVLQKGGEWGIYKKC